MLQATHLFKNLALKSKFHTRSQPLLKASIMEMPAMSPTMTEGGIVEWKFKPGEAFNSGDVLLEVETDKATIDVEALDDGVMGKIVIDNGAKGIKVGSPIAVLAEEDDDLSAIDFDALLNSKKPAAAPAAKEAPKEQAPKKEAKKVETPVSTPKPVASKKSEPISADGIFSKANKNQVLYPSVASLLHQNHISEAKALEEIPATGPNGRLLKGDVLLYLNKIDKDNYIKLNKFIQKNSVLDLSNIQLRQPAVPEKKPEPVVLQLEKVVKSTSKSIDEILKDLQKQVHAPKQQQPSVFNDPIFEELISTRYAEPIFNYKFTLSQVTKAAPKTEQYDLFDDLIGASVTNNVLSTPVNDSNDLKLNISVDLGINPKQDVLNKANDFISKVNNL